MRVDAGDDLTKWWCFRLHDGQWWTYAPTARRLRPPPKIFPSWREAYDYAHTHPSNRKETRP